MKLKFPRPIVTWLLLQSYTFVRKIRGAPFHENIGSVALGCVERFCAGSERCPHFHSRSIDANVAESGI